MKLLAELNDQTLLGLDGFSQKPSRIAVRGIVQNQEGLFALLLVGAFGTYCLPGGGREADETLEEAFRREMREEIGAVIGDVQAIGRVEENRACHDFVQTNCYFTANVVTQFSPHLTEKEKDYKISLCFLPFDEVYEKITSPHHDMPQRRYIQARDKAALDEYRRKYLKSC